MFSIRLITIIHNQQPVTVMLLNQIFDLKSAQSLSHTIIRLKSLNTAAFSELFKDNATKAPKLFQKALMVIDLQKTPDILSVDALGSMRAAIEATGASLLGVMHANQQQSDIARSCGVTIINDVKSTTASPKLTRPVSQKSRAVMTVARCRSGMQIYAKDKDLIVNGDVNYGSEVIADGSIYVYGRLLGKAIAGASGDASCHIIALSFYPELVAVAGTYAVLDNIPQGNLDACVRTYFEDDKIQYSVLQGLKKPHAHITQS